jgi:hypothetical protein
MEKKALTHTEIANLDVRYAFSSYGKAGRVVAGLLKAAARRGQIGIEYDWSRVAKHTTTYYLVTDEQVAAIRAEAIARGDR